MTPEILQALGMTKEEMTTRIVEQCADKLLGAQGFDYDGEPTFNQSKLARKLNELISKRIDDTIRSVADANVLPGVAAYIENLTLQETNSWGEKKGAPVTFIEYLTQRADAYMREEVNHDGKSKAEDSYSWQKHSTRVAYMVHQHLHYSIERAMKEALVRANSSIVIGLEGAVKLALEEATKALKVTVKT